MPRLRRDRGVAHRARAVDVRGLWTSGVGDRRHHFPGDPYSVVRLVPGDLVGGQPKKWCQRAWPTARARLGQLPHGVDVAAQAATRDGAAWPGPGVGRRSEVDETLVGGLEAGGGGRRHLGKKALVVIAAEVRGRAIGRIRMQRVADASADSLLTFVQHAVQPGSVVITDGLQSYRRLPKRGYRHDRRVLLGRGESAEAVLPRVHRVASLPQALAPGYGTHQGGVSREHLDYYLDEFTFRFNRRTSRHRGKLFHRLLEQAVAVGPVPYAAMVKGIRGRKKKRHHNR